MLHCITKSIELLWDSMRFLTICRIDDTSQRRRFFTRRGMFEVCRYYFFIVFARTSERVIRTKRNTEWFIRARDLPEKSMRRRPNTLHTAESNRKKSRRWTIFSPREKELDQTRWINTMNDSRRGRAQPEFIGKWRNISETFSPPRLRAHVIPHSEGVWFHQKKKRAPSLRRVRASSNNLLRKKIKDWEASTCRHHCCEASRQAAAPALLRKGCTAYSEAVSARVCACV